MAEILEQFDFGSKKGKKPLYPWATWSDGQIRKITHGDDFKCKPESMSVQIYNYARNNGLDAQVAIDTDSIVFKMTRRASSGALSAL